MHLGLQFRMDGYRYYYSGMPLLMHASFNQELYQLLE
jgi:hypothetical protein